MALTRVETRFVATQPDCHVNKTLTGRVRHTYTRTNSKGFSSKIHRQEMNTRVASYLNHKL